LFTVGATHVIVYGRGNTCDCLRYGQHMWLFTVRATHIIVYGRGNTYDCLRLGHTFYCC